IESGDMVWRRGTQRWVAAESVGGLFGEEPPAMGADVCPASPAVLETIKEDITESPSTSSTPKAPDSETVAVVEPARNGTPVALPLHGAPAVSVIPAPAPVRLPVAPDVQTIHTISARPHAAPPSLSVPVLFKAFCRRWLVAACLGLLLGGGAAVAMWFL